MKLMLRTSLAGLVSILLAVTPVLGQQDLHVSKKRNGFNFDPRVAVDPNTGSLLVTWTQLDLSDTSRAEVWAAFLKRKGNNTFKGKKGKLVSPASGYHNNARPSWVPGRNEFYVVWDTRRSAGVSSDIMGRSVTKKGKPKGAVATIVSDGDENYGPVMMAGDDTGSRGRRGLFRTIGYVQLVLGLSFPFMTLLDQGAAAFDDHSAWASIEVEVGTAWHDSDSTLLVGSQTQYQFEQASDCPLQAATLQIGFAADARTVVSLADSCAFTEVDSEVLTGTHAGPTHPGCCRQGADSVRIRRLTDSADGTVVSLFDVTPGGIDAVRQGQLAGIPGSTQAHQIDLVELDDPEDAVVIWVDQGVQSGILDGDLLFGDPTFRFHDDALTGLGAARIAEPGQQRAGARGRGATRPDIIVLWTRTAGSDQEIHAHLFNSEQ